MAEEKLKVIFRRVFVKGDADWFGSGEFYFIATVDGRQVGNRNRIFNAREGQWINLPEAQWSIEIDVAGKSNIVVRFQGKDEDVFFDDDLGTITHTLRREWQQGQRTHHTEYFTLEWEVQLKVAGTFARHPPDAVFACRGNPGSNTCVTVSGTTFRTRMEFQDVRPTPTTAGSTPVRPAFPAGTAPAATNTAGVVPTPADDINLIPNPPVIPILTAAQANAQTAARIEYTYYRPNTLAFTDNDARLEWKAVPISGGSVSFVGTPHGLKVLVYGTAAGEVRLEVRFRGGLLATYRALVLPLKDITCRFNILNGPTAASQPRSTPADIQNHLAIVNIYLRQVGLRLVLDTNNTKTHGAKDTAIPGIFRISVSAGKTRNISATGWTLSTRLNYRAGIMNFAYIHSDAAGVLGAGEDYPASGAGATISDNGTPSTSWISPTGIDPDGAAVNQTMTLLPARIRLSPPGVNANTGLYTMYVTDGNGDPTTPAGMQNYANTMIHELGHVLNLGHRVDTGGSPFNDGLNFPPGENIMHWNNPWNIAQDFDIIQARAVRRSPLVPP